MQQDQGCVYAAVEQASSPQEAPRDPLSGRRVAPRLAAGAAAFILLEALIFHTPLYSYFTEPESTTGMMETILRSEIRRPKPDFRQALVVGHSRMGFLPRVANELRGETGYTFGSICLGGTTPRVWYYQIRSVDPDRNRYAAVVIPCDDYDEPDAYEDLRDREADLNYVLARLKLADLWDFPWTHQRRDLQWRAVSGILFKGYVYKRDFLAFLEHPIERIRKVRWYDRDSAGWRYDFHGAKDNLAGLTVDWERKTVHLPEGFSPEVRKMAESAFFGARPPDRGLYTAYYRYWYGRIVKHYEGSGVKIIFLQTPRGPVAPPSEPHKDNSAVRQLASRPNVVLIDEHRFDELERPELFGDPFHLNGAGMERFSRMVALEVGKVLAPPRAD